MKAWHVLQKELYLYFTGTVAYAVMGVFLLLGGYFFYTDVVSFALSNVGKGATLAEGLWQPFFLDLRLVLLLTLPVLTMRLFAEEQSTGSMELLLTLPVREWELVAGKFAAPLVLLLLTEALTLAYPLVLSRIWPIDLPALAGAYLGLTLLGVVFIACGLLVSSLTRSQVVAGAGTLGVLCLSWSLTWNESAASTGFLGILNGLSLFERSYEFFGGVVNAKDVLFFAAAGLFLLYVAWLAVRRGRIGDRPAVRGTVVLFSVLLLAVLVLSVLVAGKYNRRLDLTKAQRHTLSPQTVKVLREAGPLEAVVFHRAGERFATELQVRPVAEQAPNFRYATADLDRSPALAARYGVSRYGQWVVHAGGRWARADHFSEETLVTTVLSLLRERRKQVFFVQGHGEGSLADADSRTGFGKLREALVREGYDVGAAELVPAKLPSEATVLAFLGPRKDLSATERERLRALLASGGRALFLIDTGALPNFSAVVREAGVELRGDVVVDAQDNLFAGDYLTPVAFKRGRHPVIAELDAACALPVTQSLRAAGAPGVYATELLTSGRRSFSVPDRRSLAGGDLPASSGPAGPLPVACASYRAAGAEERASLVAVLGTPNLANNYYLDVLANRDFVLNAVGWLSEEDSLVSVRQKAAGAEYRGLTGAETRRLFLVNVLLLPGALFALGLGVFLFGLRRR